MNAIVGLCHFCEAHGPRPLFCTFTTDDEDHTTEPSKCAVQCSGCTSIGSETVLISRDDDGTIFCSRESVPSTDVTAFLRQAALRSITCEVSWSKEGGVVYFSDTQGHVLSLMFHLKDTRARGLKRLFSIVVLMKDKMLLLNITPMLSEHMQKIAKELQQLAEVVYDNEQSICSQRALRLNTGRNDYGQSRSLIQLTGDAEIYKKLHSHFTWMLRIGAITYSETLYTSQDLLTKLNPQILKGTIFEDNACSVQSIEECMSLRELENLLTTTIFRILLYCTLTGVNVSIFSYPIGIFSINQDIHYLPGPVVSHKVEPYKQTILIKSKQVKASKIINSLSILLPNTNNANIHIQETNTEVLPSHNICTLEETENCNFDCKWNGTIPTKCPTLMNKIENAMKNTKFNDAVLLQHLKTLQLEWLGTVKTIKMAIQSSGKPDAVNKLKQILGVTQQDEPLVNYWSQVFCD